MSVKEESTSVVSEPNLILDLKLLCLLVVANGAPIIASNVFGIRFAIPVDLNARLWDSRPFLGPSKTYRGLAAAAVASAAAAALLGLGAAFGALFGLCAMLGDLLSSFIKRRLGLPPSDSALVLDQVPEAAAPLLVLWPWLGISVLDGIIVIAGFFIVEVLLSRVLYRMHIRKRPI
jgi:CDP-2,3-bis-(O-geranylgeranyl)-sn-glycerol synthase